MAKMESRPRSGWDLIFSDDDPRRFEAFPVITFEEFQLMQSDSAKSAENKQAEEESDWPVELKGFVVKRFVDNKCTTAKYALSGEPKKKKKMAKANKNKTEIKSGGNASSKPKEDSGAQTGSTKETWSEFSCKNHLFNLSPGLAKLVGSEQLDAESLMKKLKEMILAEKTNELDGSKFAILNDQLHEVLGVRRVSMDNLMSCVWRKHATCSLEACPECMEKC